jgi:tetratricopeptide (TPR) repeat protein
MTMQHVESQVEKPFNAQQVVRRLAAAEGYLELQMPLYAIAELNRVSDAGPFEPIAQLFRGEALQAQEKYADAIAPLNLAAHLFPTPFNRRAFMSLSNCYRHEGLDRLADEAAEAASAVEVEQPPENKIIHLMIEPPIFQVKSSGGDRMSFDKN